MKKHTAHDILIKITETLLKYLEELSCLEKSNEFAYGERVAYIECLEIIQVDKFVELGYNFNTYDVF